jgi:hypothetical protein
MGLIFKDRLHDEFGTWPLAYIPYGGADFGEVAAVGGRLATGMTPPSTTPGLRLQTGWQARHKGLRTGDERPALATCS